jgi:hypothetical protein
MSKRDAGVYAIEQGRGYDMVAVRGEVVADAADVGGDAEYLLQQHEAAAWRPLRPRLVGAEPVSVARVQCNRLSGHDVIDKVASAASTDRNDTGNIHTFGMLTHRNSQCDDFWPAERDRLEQRCCARTLHEPELQQEAVDGVR